MTIVDTTVWIDYIAGRSNPQTEWMHRKLGEETFGLTDLILCEVLQGIREESTFRYVQREISQFDIFPTGGAGLAIASANNYRRLRSRGSTVRKTIDCMIATFCLNEDYPLLHRDRDFDAFEKHLGLRVIHP